MKHILAVLLFAPLLFASCTETMQTDLPVAEQDTVQHTRIKSHIQGHPADPPPPCTRCNDKIISELYPQHLSAQPKDTLDILSFDNYVFFEAKLGNERFHYMAHKSQIEGLGLAHNDKVRFTLEPHYVLDCDTIVSSTNTTYVYFNTGIKLMLPDTVIKDNKGDFKYVEKSRIKGQQNLLPNASLFNAGYVKTDQSRRANGYISQDYYYLGQPQDLANDTFFMHLEKMVVFKGKVNMGQEYHLDVAVDIQINTHRANHVHAIGEDDHEHL